MKFLKLLIIFIVLNIYSQENAYSQENNYFDKKQFKGFYPALDQLIDYDDIKSSFTYFNFDKDLYNLIFYKGHISESSRNAKYIRLELILAKEYYIFPKLFHNYKITLNPNLKKSQFSKHELTISVRDSLVTTNFRTKSLSIDFPSNTLQTKDSLTTKLLINTDSGIEHNNIRYTNTELGLNIKEITSFEIPPSYIPNSFIEFSDFEESQLNYRIRGAYEEDYSFFEENKLLNFLNDYRNIAKLKRPNEYKNAIQFKDVKGKVKFIKPIECTINEVYFFEDMIVGVIDFDNSLKNRLIEDANKLWQENYTLKTNGDFPSFTEWHGNTCYKLEQGFKSIRMYFFKKNEAK